MRLTVLWLRPERRAKPGAPVGGVLGGTSKVNAITRLNVSIVNHPGATAALLVQQAVQPLFQESGTPFPHRDTAYPQLGGQPQCCSGHRHRPERFWPVQGQRLGSFGPAGDCYKVSRSAPSGPKARLVCPCPYPSSLLSKLVRTIGGTGIL